MGDGFWRWPLRAVRHPRNRYLYQYLCLYWHWHWGRAKPKATRTGGFRRWRGRSSALAYAKVPGTNGEHSYLYSYLSVPALGCSQCR